MSKNKSKKNNICNPDCLYFPDHSCKEESRYMDENGIIHIVREYICEYDDHRILNWENCPHYRKA